MFGLGAPELLIVLVVVLVLFGGKRLPDLARSLGTAKREFHEGSLEAAREATAEAAVAERPTPTGT